ncbi:hypothetical protein AUL39_04800 [Tractidigestivibacter scatoligenes]|uniref:Uncharacterized protein n=1 Tax=Tractidigestivibacter scatoligenes TaxID=1299998 RepID=A0A117J4G2_TRASO|nr:hypothetical protein AUL39_04800 [Tractidigestivibacter scatoligenes]
MRGGKRWVTFRRRVQTFELNAIPIPSSLIADTAMDVANLHCLAKVRLIQLFAIAKDEADGIF